MSALVALALVLLAPTSGLAKPHPDAERAAIFVLGVNPDGTLRTQRMSYRDAERCCPTCHVTPDDYFFDSVRTLNNMIVRRCVQEIPEGRSVNVDLEYRRLCDSRYWGLDDITQRPRARYRIRRAGDGVQINYKIRFKVAPSGTSAARAREMLRSVQSCGPEFNKVWNRYGIALDIASDLDTERTAGAPDRVVVLDDRVDGPRRSNSDLVYFQGIGNGATDSCIRRCERRNRAPDCRAYCEPKRQNELCLLLLHETGHHLGLFDEYRDPECPDRPYVSKHKHPHAVMDNQWIAEHSRKGWDAIEFFPENIRQILNPLCATKYR